MARHIRLGLQAQKLISSAVDTLFDRIKARLLGHGAEERLWGRRLEFRVQPQHTLTGLYDTASEQEGVAPRDEVRRSLLKIAGSYVDASREKTKARVIQEVQAFLVDAQAQGVKTDAHTVLGGKLSDVWGEVKTDIRRIAETEATTVRNTSIYDAVSRVAATTGRQDPTVFFVVVRDDSRCQECTRLHLLDDSTTPRCWKLSEVGSGYHHRGDPNPKVAGLHPNCFTGSQRLASERGLLRFDQLVNTGALKLVVDNRAKNRRVPANQFGKENPGDVWWYRHASGTKVLSSDARGIYETGVQECLRIELEGGRLLEVSLGHEQWVDDGTGGKKVRASELQVGDKLPLISGPGLWGSDHGPAIAELAGSLLGDGSLSGNTASWHFFGNDLLYGHRLLKMAQQLGCRVTAPVRPPDKKYSVERMVFGSSKLARIMRDYGVDKKPRRVPKPIWTSDEETVSAFLRGLFAADGHVESHSVVLAQNDKDFLREIQLLLSNYGIPARIFDHGEAMFKAITYADGRRFVTARKPCWRLVVGDIEGIRMFAEKVGMGVPIKDKRLNVTLVSHRDERGSVWRTDRIKSIVSVGSQQTFCVTEPMTHTVTVNGIVTGQCRCTLTHLLPGYGFDGAGRVTYITPDHDELAVQRR